MTNDELNAKLDNLKFPKVTKELITSRIKSVDFLGKGTLTICVLTLENGFTVTGESACVDPRNFNAEMGQKIAYDMAFNKIWSLEGYVMATNQNADKKLAVTCNDEPALSRLDSIARVCHEVNRAYCQAMGDDSQAAWNDAPAWQHESARMGVKLHLSGDFGPEASHASWMKQKLDDGWEYGPVKNAETKTHPCIMPFDQLPKEQQAKDYIFRAVVHALS